MNEKKGYALSSREFNFNIGTKECKKQRKTKDSITFLNQKFDSTWRNLNDKI